MEDHGRNLVIHSLPSSKDRLPLFIVGDVHGCAYELYQLLKIARRKVSHFQLVLVGDLFTKGPDPVGVLQLIEENNAICIKGNHDWALISILHQVFRRQVRHLSDHSQQTLYLIRNHRRSFYDFLKSLPHALVTEIQPLISHKDWEETYPMEIVHAGIDCSVGLENTAERFLLTARYVKWNDKKRLTTVPSAYRQEALSELYAKAPTERPGSFRWHELHKGPELIVFGHDAKQGLFRKVNQHGRPICLGLDTGCTYGRCLTGYFPEFDEPLQVQSRRTYFDIRRNRIIVRTPPFPIAV